MKNAFHTAVLAVAIVELYVIVAPLLLLPGAAVLQRASVAEMRALERDVDRLRSQLWDYECQLRAISLEARDDRILMLQLRNIFEGLNKNIAREAPQR
jgi:hypothetical protein